MNWDQIENEWAAMARRMRPDWLATSPCGSAPQPLSDTEGVPANEVERTLVEDLTPIAREVA